MNIYSLGMELKLPKNFATYARLMANPFLALAVVVGIFLSTPDAAFAAEKPYNGRASAPKAYSLAKENTVELIDIRRPSEWRTTGVGKGAHRISMHQSGFINKIDRLTGGDRSKPIALICARGNRSARMKAKLNSLGFTNVINVSEGMLGSKAGPGWLKRKLPTR